YVEQGRRLLLDGDYLRALPYLSAAYSAGDDSAALRFMLHRALKLADTPTFPGSVPGLAMYRGDDQILSVDNRGGATIWDIASHRAAANLPAQSSSSGPIDLVDAATPDGRLVAIARPTEVLVWDGSITQHIPVAQARNLAFDASGDRLAI